MTATETVRSNLAVRMSSFPLIRAERRAVSEAVDTQAYGSLYDEFVEAFSAGPQTIIDTPAYPSVPRQTVAEVVNDDFAGRNSALDEALNLIALAAAGANVQAVAKSWIAARAAAHATYHCEAKTDELRADRSPL